MKVKEIVVIIFVLVISVTQIAMLAGCNSDDTNPTNGEDLLEDNALESDILKPGEIIFIGTAYYSEDYPIEAIAVKNITDKGIIVSFYYSEDRHEIRNVEIEIKNLKFSTIGNSIITDYEYDDDKISFFKSKIFEVIDGKVTITIDDVTCNLSMTLSITDNSAEGTISCIYGAITSQNSTGFSIAQVNLGNRPITLSVQE